MTRSTRHLRTSAALALAGGVIVALGGCAQGGDDSESAASGDAAVSSPTIISDGALRICASYGSPPNIYVEDDGVPIGAEVDIAHALAENLGLEVEFSEYKFSGLVPALQAKQCDVIMSSLYIKPEREEVANFVPYLQSGSAVLVTRDNPEGITGFDDSLCGTKVIAITGATGALKAEEKSAECEENGEAPISLTLADDITSLQQVLAGQADAFIDTAELAGYYEKLGDFTLVGEPFGDVTIGAATLKDNTELHEAMQGAFDEIVDDGTYADILAEWGLEAQDITAQ